MDAIFRGLTCYNGYLYNRLETGGPCGDDTGDDTGDDITSPGKNDDSNRHGGRHRAAPAGKYMQRKKGSAFVLSQSDLYFSIFYDSLYA